MAQFSDLSFIEINDSSNPSSLFHQWKEEAQRCGISSFLINLATVKNGQPRNRTLVIKEIMSDGSLAFTAHANSAKIEEIKENPQVAATILLMYANGNQNVTRQIRLEGIAEKLSQEQCRRYYDLETLPAKIRGHICQECRPVEWTELKEKHDALLKDVTENKRELEMPNTEVAYKIVPNMMEFYSAIGNTIADRISFKLENKHWKSERLMA